MKKEIKVVAIVLVALIVFLAGFGLGATKGININIGSESGINVNVNGGNAGSAQVVAPQTTVPTTQAPVTQPPVTVAPPASDTPATDAPATDAPATDAPATDAPSGTSIPSTKAEIVAAYNKAVNDAKHYTGKVTLKKHDIIDVQLKDLPAIAEKIITPVIANLTKTEPKEAVFENAVGVDDNTRELTKWIIPGGGRDAALQEAGVATATATANADGGYTMVITLVPETSTFDGTSTTSEPTHHKSIMDPLELGSLDLGPITISNADLKYPGATMTATVDSQGRLTYLKQQLPLEGTGTGKAGISLTLNLAGSMDGTYEFIYA
ncbi:MAG: hypothetical protein IJN88_05325 [Clostridia bacterium]|nr:hypothetical protein [Clostridia bacterium]